MTILKAIGTSLALVLTGCGPKRPMTGSDIPKALNTDALMQSAGGPQGLKLGRSKYLEASDLRSAWTERRFSGTISSGTIGQLMAAYRREVERTITASGGKIYANGLLGTADDVKDFFSFDYTSAKNDGIVKVYFFEKTGDEVQVVSLCYEHQK